jgi:DNA-binding NtrC family response regulator
MPCSVCVLLFGNDLRLLESRRLVLESAGCTVYTAMRLLAVNQILTERPIDLLILCHSLTTEECERAKSVVEAQSPKVKVLILTAANFTQCNVRADGVVNAGEGPKALLECVNQMARKIPPDSDPERARASAAKASA